MLCRDDAANKLPYLQVLTVQEKVCRADDVQVMTGQHRTARRRSRGLVGGGQIQQPSERDCWRVARSTSVRVQLMAWEVVKINTGRRRVLATRLSAKLLPEPASRRNTMGSGLLLLKDLSYIILYEDVADNFKRWLHNQGIGGISSMLIGRKSLALTGLFHI
jgi:hypothetical protein